jgi:hypothetical protein
LTTGRNILCCQSDALVDLTKRHLNRKAVNHMRSGILGALVLCVSYPASAGGLKPARGEVSSGDGDMKDLGEACVAAETEWKKDCGCGLTVMFDLTEPKYRKKRLFDDDQHLMVKHACEEITEEIPRVCKKQAAAMCKMTTLNFKRVDVDKLGFTVTGSTGNGQLNWDDFRTGMDAISFVLTGRRQ